MAHVSPRRAINQAKFLFYNRTMPKTVNMVVYKDGQENLLFSNVLAPNGLRVNIFHYSPINRPSNTLDLFLHYRPTGSVVTSFRWFCKIGCSLSCGQRIYSLYMSHRPWILSQCHLVGVGTSSKPSNWCPRMVILHFLNLLMIACVRLHYRGINW